MGPFSFFFDKSFCQESPNLAMTVAREPEAGTNRGYSRTSFKKDSSRQNSYKLGLVLIVDTHILRLH